MSFSRQWCEMLAHYYAKSGVEKSPAALLLQYGAEYPDRRPAPWRGTPKACYANAQYLVKRRPGWRYVEGFATALVPIEHAWCLNPDGQVIDPTLEQASDYFGVAIDMAVVRRIRRLPEAARIRSCSRGGSGNGSTRNSRGISKPIAI
jgi:hypothetical protein